MAKTRTPMCKFRRRNKQAEENWPANGGLPNEEESDDELNFENEKENEENLVEHKGENNEENEGGNGANDHAELAAGHEPESPLCLEDPDCPAVDEEPKEAANAESLNDLLDKMENDEVDLDKLKDLSLTVEDKASDLNNLQSFVSNKLVELMKKSSFGEKCMESLAPLCTGGNGADCGGPLNKLLSLGHGCFAEAPRPLNDGELQVPEKEDYRDPPTLPSGIKFVDDFNKLLDGWADQPATGSYSANVFKLFNLSALLKHLGDPRYVEILNKLGVNNLMAAENQKKWDEILVDVAAPAPEAPKQELPELPNAGFVSNCEARLVDLPQLDDNAVDEHAFKLYWAYTNTWLNKMFGPSFRNSYRFLQPTKNWYMNMERASQLFFLRLSKTLCAVQ